MLLKILLILISFLCASVTFGSTHYVSPSGVSVWGDSTSIGTPCSITTAMANAGSTEDDIVYLLDGTYTGLPTLSYTIDNIYSVTFTSYSQDKTAVIIDCSDAEVAGVGKGQFRVDGDDQTWSHMTINYYYTGIWRASSLYGKRLHIHNMTFNATDGVTTDNGGAVAYSGIDCDGTDAFLFENNLVNSDNDPSSTNSSGVYINIADAIIRNNEIVGKSTGIYLKHPNAESGANVYIYNNYIHNGTYEGPPNYAIYGLYNDVHVTNNIFVGRQLNIGANAGGGCDSNTSCDGFVIDHNTFFGNDIEVWDAPDCSSWNVTNNIIMTDPTYNDATLGWSKNYNIYPTGFLHGETNSLTGTPTFSEESPSEISDYKLTSESIGYQAAADGTDIGADISLVGIRSQHTGKTQTGTAYTQPGTGSFTQ